VNQPGSLAALTTLIAKMGANITVLKIRSRHSDSVDFFMDIEVKNVEQLDEIIALLRMSSWVLSAKRWGHP
jgi:GTP pyrophosphokinase